MRADPPPIGFAPPSIDETDIEAVTRVLRSGWLSTGVECEQFEAELSAVVGAPHVVAVSSCTAALEIALDAQRFRPGARVGVPTWTFAASASTVVRAGGVPVLLDIDEETLNVSVDALEAELAQGLDGVVLVHFGGLPVARQVLDATSAAGIPVVEDAAHAFGATDHRGPVSGLGTVGACFSFYASKNLTSGEGGALATHDPELAAYARSHRLHGLSSDAWQRYRVGAEPSYDLVEPGLKANMADLLAALGRSQLARFGQLQARRRAAVRCYRELLRPVDGLRVVPTELDERSADHLLVVLLPPGVDRGHVIASLGRQGIGCSIHFRPLHTFSWFAANVPIGVAGVAVADRLADRALSLPLHAGLTDEDVDRVVTALVQELR